MGCSTIFLHDFIKTISGIHAFLTGIRIFLLVDRTDVFSSDVQCVVSPISFFPYPKNNIQSLSLFLYSFRLSQAASIFSFAFQGKNILWWLANTFVKYYLLAFLIEADSRCSEFYILFCFFFSTVCFMFLSDPNSLLFLDLLSKK